MSGNHGWIERGLRVAHRGKLKVVKDWHFTVYPRGCPHNSDVLVVEFEDGSDTGLGGLGCIDRLDECGRVIPKSKLDTRESLRNFIEGTNSQKGSS